MGVIVGNTNSNYFGSTSEREKHLVDLIVSTMRSSEQETAPTRSDWKRNELLFAGKQDWGAEGEREDWRSKLFIHEYAPIIRDAAVSAQTQIFSRADFINLVANDTVNQEFADVLHKLIKYYVDEIGFAQLFYEWCLVGGIYGSATWKLAAVNKTVIRPEIVVEMVQKAEAQSLKGVSAANKETFMMPNSLEEVQTGLEQAMTKIFGNRGQGATRQITSKRNIEIDLELSVVNPHNYFWLPDVTDINLSPYHIEKYYKTFADISGLIDSGVFDKKKRDRILKHASKNPDYTSSTVDNYQLQKQRQRDQLTSGSTYWPMVEVVEYFGPILDRMGDIIDENRHVIIVNGKFVAKDAPNGYWDQKSPYRTAVFNRRPFKPGGAGIADAAVNSQLIINDLVSLFVDALKLDIYAPLAVNIDRLSDKSQLEAGIEPGMLIELYDTPKASDVFSELPKQTNNTGPELFQTIEMLKMAGQKGSSINTMTSNPSSRARISSAEIKSNDNRRNENLNTLGFEIDCNGITPLIGRLLSLVVQFGFTNSNVELLASKGILTESERQLIANMTTFQRFEEGMKHFKVDVRGFRAALERDQYLSRVGEYMSQINVMPPFVHDMLDWKQIIKDTTEAYGFDGAKWILQETPQDTAREENNFLQTGRFVATQPNDDDGAHLPIHFDALMKAGPQPALIQHARLHIQGAMQKGIQIPPPPPEVAHMLGLPPPPSEDAQQQQKVTTQLAKQTPMSPTKHLQ